jgi:outer membrane immunogenic protein
MLRGIFLASTALALCAAVPALAQPVAGHTWTGPYVGVNVGYGGNEFKYDAAGALDTGVTPAVGPAAAASTATFSGTAKQTSGGFVGGGQVGFNYQFMSGWVLGAEADIDGSGIEGKDTLTGVATDSTGATGSLSASIGSKIDYIGTVRARAGYPMFDNRLLPYVTGGLAYGGVKSSASFALTGVSLGGMGLGNAGSISKSSTRVGWTIGAGADYALTDRLSLRAEYLFADLGKENLVAGSTSLPVLGAALSGRLDMSTSANLVRVGLNYRFGG